MFAILKDYKFCLLKACDIEIRYCFKKEKSASLKNKLEVIYHELYLVENLLVQISRLFNDLFLV